jgi:hypothetical protein
MAVFRSPFMVRQSSCDLFLQWPILSLPKILNFPLNHPVWHLLVTEWTRHPVVHSALTEDSHSESLCMSLAIHGMNKTSSISVSLNRRQPLFAYSCHEANAIKQIKEAHELLLLRLSQREASSSDVCPSSLIALPCILSLRTFLPSLPISLLLYNMIYSIPFFLRYGRRLIQWRTLSSSLFLCLYLASSFSCLFFVIYPQRTFLKLRQLASFCLSVCLSVCPYVTSRELLIEL